MFASFHLTKTQFLFLSLSKFCMALKFCKGILGIALFIWPLIADEVFGSLIEYTIKIKAKKGDCLRIIQY